jgi:hypothetical protein
LNGKGRQHKILDWFGSAILSAVLVFGLIASPWIIECIPEDGKVLVELMGQDPCHHPRGHAAVADRHLPPGLDSSDPGDPCLDIVLDNLGLTQNGMDLYVPSQSDAAQAAIFLVDAECIFAPFGSRRLFKLAREPVDPGMPDSCQPATLRI